jgi:prolipoprotein diacylglyceryltransferase
LIIGLMVVSLADFLGGPGLGTLTSVPWGMSQFGIRRHAVQLYELSIGAAALLLWWQLSKQPGKAGQMVLGVTAVYSTGRLFFDAYRANTPLTANGYHILQIIMLVILLTSLFLLGLISPPQTNA